MTAVVLDHAGAETGPASIQQLWNQADFRRQQQHTAPHGQFLGGGLEIHLGFPGTGDTPQQEGLAPSGRRDRRHRSRLGGWPTRGRSSPPWSPRLDEPAPAREVLDLRSQPFCSRV